MIRSLPLLFLMVSSLASADPIPTPDPLGNSKRIVFLGDSITNDGHYIVLLQAALRDKHPDAEFINLGLPSEGVTGLSEPAHPFPRPNVHERLDRALAKTNPDLVIACYGMNDGIYYPFGEERFRQYKEGINILIEKVDAHGAQLILLTPPPFDPLPFRKKGKLLPIDAKEFSWSQIYEHYDREVIAPYGKWILAQSDRVHAVADLHGPMNKHVRNLRKANPELAYSQDGVHLDKDGHKLMADTIHRALYGNPLPESPAETIALLSKQHSLLHPAWISHVGHKRPGVKPGLPLKEAKKKAKALTAK